MRLFVVGSFEKRHTIDVLGREVPLDLVWADGQVGALPVFRSRGAAQRYAGKRFQVFEIEAVDVAITGTDEGKAGKLVDAGVSEKKGAKK